MVSSAFGCAREYGSSEALLLYGVSPYLIRMEYSASSIFEDRASQAVFFRDIPWCDYSCNREAEMLYLETEDFKLCYQENQPFSVDSLQLQLKIKPCSIWRFGVPFETLDGTVKSLDTVDFYGVNL